MTRWKINEIFCRTPEPHLISIVLWTRTLLWRHHTSVPPRSRLASTHPCFFQEPKSVVTAFRDNHKHTPDHQRPSNLCILIYCTVNQEILRGGSIVNKSHTTLEEWFRHSSNLPHLSKGNQLSWKNPKPRCCPMHSALRELTMYVTGSLLYPSQVLMHYYNALATMWAARM